jgi:CheY-like chemotaxis protein
MGTADLRSGTGAVNHAEMANLLGTLHFQWVAPAKILVVDDEPSLCYLTCRMLREAGYEVEGVYSARAALSFLRPNRPYDLFVLDVRLPDMSGIELANLVVRQYQAGPFLFISGFPETHGEKPPDTRWEFVAKPFSSDQLLKAVRQLLQAEPTNSP